MSNTMSLMDAVVETQIAEADAVIARGAFATEVADLTDADASLAKAAESIPALQLLARLREQAHAA